MNRLQEKIEVISVRSCGFKHIGGGGLAGKQQDFAIRAIFSHSNCQLDPGYQRHHDVGNQEVGSIEPSGFQCLERLRKALAWKPP